MIIYSFIYANVRWASLLMCTNNTIQCPYFHNDRLSIVRLLIYDMQVSNTGRLLERDQVEWDGIHFNRQIWHPSNSTWLIIQFNKLQNIIISILQII